MASFVRAARRWCGVNSSVLKFQTGLWRYSTGGNTSENVVQVAKSKDTSVEEVTPDELVSLYHCCHKICEYGYSSLAVHRPLLVTSVVFLKSS